MEKTLPFDFSPVAVTITKVTAPSRKLNVDWTLDYTGYTEIYELSDEEKEGLSHDEQETWKILKTTTETVDLEQEIMEIMSANIAKEIDAEILRDMVSYAGTRTK